MAIRACLSQRVLTEEPLFARIKSWCAHITHIVQRNAAPMAWAPLNSIRTIWRYVQCSKKHTLRQARAIANPE